MTRGPLPKPEGMRQRRNRESTRATLTPVPATSRRKPPPLPAHHAWDALTVAWWRDVWRSPMASEYLTADVHGLYVLAELVDRFWADPSTQLAAEIRQQRQCFGLTPIDRRRLQWEVERVEAVARKRRPAAPDRSADDDPRKLLSVV